MKIRKYGPLTAHKKLIVAGTAILLLFGVLAAAWLTYTSLFAKKVQIRIEDRCGVMMGSVLHSLESEDTCLARCRSQCRAMDLNYHSSNYQTALQGCNNCTCICRE